VGAQLCLSPDCGIVSSEQYKTVLCYVSLGYSPTHGTELMPIGMVMDSHILGTDAESWYLARNTRKKKRILWCSGTSVYPYSGGDRFEFQPVFLIL
jgi:hypothetical protein